MLVSVAVEWLVGKGLCLVSSSINSSSSLDVVSNPSEYLSLAPL